MTVKQRRKTIICLSVRMREVADRGEGQVCGLGAEDGSSPSS